MERVLSIWLPDWPLQRLLVARPELKDRAVVLYDRDSGRGERVVVCSPAAHDRGVRVGMPLAEAACAKAAVPASGASSIPGRQRVGRNVQNDPGKISPSVVFHPHDIQADRESLEDLAEWCDQFSPLVGLESNDFPSTLLLEVAGVASLFGGEDALARRVTLSFQQRGYTVCIAIADTVGAAWALSHFGVRSAECVVRSAEGEGLAALALLPLPALRLPEEVVELLGGLGVDRIGQLIQMPRADLSSRFGSQLVRRLEQAEGTVRELVVAHRAAPSFQAGWSLEHPTDSRPVTESLIAKLLQRVAGLLVERDQGAMELECQLQTICSDETDPLAAHRASEITIRVGLFQPTARVAHLWELVKIQLEGVRLPGPLSGVMVQAVTTAPLQSRQYELFDGEVLHTERQLAALIDRLSSRLGRGAVLAARWRADAQPERACRYVPMASGRSPHNGRQGRLGRKKRRRVKSVRYADARPDREGEKERTLTPAVRPLRLCCPPLPLEALSVAPDGPPIQFSYQNQLRRIVRHWGPERIETGWWRGPSVRRDYYRAETADGCHFWIFRCLRDEKWFLQGEFV